VNTPPPYLLTGASGYVGGRLAPVLLERGHAVRCLMRKPDPEKVPDGAEAMKGDAVSGEGLDEALDGVEVAFYLIHSMGRGASEDEDFAARDRTAARNFGRAAKRAGVRRIVYLGGLPSNNGDSSHHLDSRDETAEILRDFVPELSYARAAMVLGGESASFEMLHALVTRLPVMITPKWVDVRSQPISIEDVIEALAALAERDEYVPEAHLGGADVLTYREMMKRFADAMDGRRPKIWKTPVLSPSLSSHWVGLVTPVETGLARPLVDGLRSEMIVQTPPPCGINDSPLGFEDGVRAALKEREASSSG
jgi:uncharacterized protein YbjT (DUF2867 family)